MLGRTWLQVARLGLRSRSSCSGPYILPSEASGVAALPLVNLNTNAMGAGDDDDDDDGNKAVESPHAHGHARGAADGGGASLPAGMAADRGASGAIFSAHLGRSGVRVASDADSLIPRGTEEPDRAGGLSIGRSISDRFSDQFSKIVGKNDRFASGFFAVRAPFSCGLWYGAAAHGMLMLLSGPHTRCDICSAAAATATLVYRMP